jgi:hypothetical protein
MKGPQRLTLSEPGALRPSESPLPAYFLPAGFFFAYTATAALMGGWNR